MRSRPRPGASRVEGHTEQHKVRTMDDQELIKEFLIESNENLARLDQEMVELEERPTDAELLASVFRTIHTIKGTCGFLGLTKLEGIAHLTENILSQLRNGERELTPELTSLILEAVDAIKQVLACIEADGSEGAEDYEELREKLLAAAEASGPARVGGKPAAGTSQLEPDAATTDAKPTPPGSGDGKQDEETSAGPAGAPAREETAPGGGAVVPKPSSKGTSLADSTIRVDVELLDKLMNLVGELVLTRNQILQFHSQFEGTTLNATAQRLNLITTELQESVMKTRMQPIGVIWNKFPRVVRDLARSFGKQIQLEMDGSETELDRTIIEAIKDPLTHLVRNSCDHGIERPEVRVGRGKPPQGKLILRAYHEGGQVNIEITDDGAGIDVEKLKAKAIRQGMLSQAAAERLSEREALNLVFHPGISTAEQVTNVSGRGVGMDVVKTNIERIGGTVDISSRVGEGTTVRVKIPLTLAIIPGLVVASGNELFVIPQVSLLELIRLEGEAARTQIEQIGGTPVYRHRGKLLPIAYLDRVLELERTGDEEVVNIVVLQAEDRQFGLVVDEIRDTQEIVVKPLGKQLKGLACYAGATIMGDGRVALILDVLGVGQRSGVLSEAGEQGRLEEPKQEAPEAERQTLLLFRTGRFERLAVPLALVSRLEEIPWSKIEIAAGRLVVQYRNQILPLARLAAVLDPAAEAAGEKRDPAQVIVFSDGDRSAGLLVDEVLDIVEETVTVRQPTKVPGLLGSAVVSGKVTDFLDLHYALERAVENWFDDSTRNRRCAAVLVADPSAFSRLLIRNYLEIAGHCVAEATTAAEALQQLQARRFDVVLAAAELAPAHGKSLAELMGERPGLDRIPIVAMAADQTVAERLKDAVMKFDQEAVLRSVEKLAEAVGTRREIEHPVER